MSILRAPEEEREPQARKKTPVGTTGGGLHFFDLTNRLFTGLGNMFFPWTKRLFLGLSVIFDPQAAGFST